MKTRELFTYVEAIGKRRATAAEFAKLIDLLNTSEGQPYLGPAEGKRMMQKLVANGSIKITPGDYNDDEDMED